MHDASAKEKNGLAYARLTFPHFTSNKKYSSFFYIPCLIILHIGGRTIGSLVWSEIILRTVYVRVSLTHTYTNITEKKHLFTLKTRKKVDSNRFNFSIRTQYFKSTPYCEEHVAMLLFSFYL